MPDLPCTTGEIAMWDRYGTSAFAALGMKIGLHRSIHKEFPSAIKITDTAGVTLLPGRKEDVEADFTKALADAMNPQPKAPDAATDSNHQAVV